MKILKIENDQSQTVTLPDGTYMGKWGGYIIDISYEGMTYNLTTDVGVKGIDIEVEVTVSGGVATYSQIDN